MTATRNRPVAPVPPSSVAEVVARVEQGEVVAPLDLAAAEASERLAVITDTIERKRAADAQRAADAAERERLIGEFATEADALNARMIGAVARLHATADEVTTIRDEIDRTIRLFADALRPLGLPLERHTISDKTDRRVVLAPDYLGSTMFKVPASLEYERWVRNEEARRAAS
jgi:hypothetical protein